MGPDCPCHLEDRIQALHGVHEAHINPAAAGVLQPWGITLRPEWGALIMSASTIIVAVNALLLRGVKLSG